jgi:hypothetical protein
MNPAEQIDRLLSALLRPSADAGRIRLPEDSRMVQSARIHAWPFFMANKRISRTKGIPC